MAEPLLPSDYQSFLGSIKERVQRARLQAVLSVNRELILLYWHIGKEIIKQQEQLGWGAGVIERLSRDLHAAFPEMIMWNAIRVHSLWRFRRTRSIGIMVSFS